MRETNDKIRSCLIKRKFFGNIMFFFPFFLAVEGSSQNRYHRSSTFISDLIYINLEFGQVPGPVSYPDRP